MRLNTTSWLPSIRSSVSVFGAITGAVDGPHQGSRIPAIAADFVLKGHP